METLHDEFINVLSRGLKRATIIDAAKWTMNYRVIKRTNAEGEVVSDLWTFEKHPWLYDMHMCKHEFIIGQKAAQMGFTEWAMNMVFYYINEKYLDALYMLPTSDDARDFSNGRFDPALEESEHLRDMFSNVDNVGLKRAGAQCLYVRGSKSRSKLKSIPVAVIVMDEVAEMCQENIPLALERQAGQQKKIAIKISTPTLENKNINIDYKQSTQDQFTFQCPKCSRHVFLRFPDDLVVVGEHANDPNILKSHLKCPKCEGKLEHEDKVNFLKHKAFGGTSEFVSQFNDARYQGYNISQLYSTTRDPVDIARMFFDAKADPAIETELYNSRGGVVHEVEGARITEAQLDHCIKNYTKKQLTDGRFRTMGVDVGSVLHIVVKEWKLNAKTISGLLINDQLKPRVVYEGTSTGHRTDFKEAYQLFKDLKCFMGVVDAEPERRAALSFAHTLRGRMFLCDYQISQKGKSLTLSTDEDLTIKANRTSWLDLSLGRYKTGLIDLPTNVSVMFRDQIKNMVRTYKKDRDGNDVGYYENTGPDHFAHADVYSEIAVPLFFQYVQQTETIK